jgi:hypothetical protein
MNIFEPASFVSSSFRRASESSPGQSPSAARRPRSRPTLCPADLVATHAVHHLYVVHLVQGHAELVSQRLAVAATVEDEFHQRLARQELAESPDAERVRAERHDVDQVHRLRIVRGHQLS